VRRPRASGDDERAPSVRAITGDLLFERVYTNAELCIGRDLPDVPVWEAGEVRRLLERVVDLVRAVERALREVVARQLVARSRDRGEVRQRAARRQHSSRAARQADDLAEPAHDVRFYLREEWRRGADADVAVHGV